MTYDPKKHHRRSIRSKEYDYSQTGAYFITICAYNKECIFGEIIDGKMVLNELGKIAWNEWNKTALIRKNMKIDEYIVMPNHLHGVIIITDDCRGTLQRAPTFERFSKPVSNSMPTIIRLFKSTTTKQINKLRRTPGLPVWQRNYYEHIIRNEDELNQIREYTVNNLIKWALDKENPRNVRARRR